MGPNIPESLLSRYVMALTLTYVGYKGYSIQFSRTDFYSDSAAPIIKKMFKRFDDSATTLFVSIIYNSEEIRTRIQYPEKLNRLRTLARILLDNEISPEEVTEFLELLVDEERTEKFSKTIKRYRKRLTKK